MLLRKFLAREGGNTGGEKGWTLSIQLSESQGRPVRFCTRSYQLFYIVDIILSSPFLDTMEDHFKKMSGLAMCVGCGNQIHDPFILRVSPDLKWHAACLKCVECSQYLDETCTCFVREGKTYCKRDYVRLFGIKCAKCGLGFSSSDLVMRTGNNIYHIKCFRCSTCGRLLLPGEEFTVRKEALLCRGDHGPDNMFRPGHSRAFHMAAVPVSVRQVQHRSHAIKSSEKTTRVRTVLNEKQLHTLRTCYNANPRPDALMKEQLVEMTGLSPRVIRVWFQNKRCKDKKRSILMKQLQQQHEDTANLQALAATALVAVSPIGHNPSLVRHAIEMQNYTPWKALSEFVLYSDLEQPTFQQLVSFSESGSLENSSGSDVISLSLQLPDTPNSMVPSPVETRVAKI
ncbi:insulin gene enhancer protein isl-2b-like [Salminus brasiliensis]|uniref:insulin gene enhancer protein isl-2b-like n=1 Tax=Salminus brasiliensis TaxID=930266 RepID=UPI003B8392F9